MQCVIVYREVKKDIRTGKVEARDLYFIRKEKGKDKISSVFSWTMKAEKAKIYPDKNSATMEWADEELQKKYPSARVETASKHIPAATLKELVPEKVGGRKELKPAESIKPEDPEAEQRRRDDAAERRKEYLRAYSARYRAEQKAKKENACAAALHGDSPSEKARPGVTRREGKDRRRHGIAKDLLCSYLQSEGKEQTRRSTLWKSNDRRYYAPASQRHTGTDPTTDCDPMLHGDRPNRQHRKR